MTQREQRPSEAAPIELVYGASRAQIEARRQQLLQAGRLKSVSWAHRTRTASVEEEWLLSTWRKARLQVLGENMRLKQDVAGLEQQVKYWKNLYREAVKECADLRLSQAQTTASSEEAVSQTVYVPETPEAWMGYPVEPAGIDDIEELPWDV